MPSNISSHFTYDYKWTAYSRQRLKQCQQRPFPLSPRLVDERRRTSTKASPQRGQCFLYFFYFLYFSIFRFLQFSFCCFLSVLWRPVQWAFVAVLVTVK